MKLKSAVIYSENGMTVDVLQLIEEVVIYESIQGNTLSGTVIMVDTSNLPESLPFLGREILGLSYTGATKNPDLLQENIIVFDILALKDITARNTEAKAYSLEIASRPTLYNNTLSLNRRYTGSTSNIVSEILTDDMLMAPEDLEIQEIFDGITFIPPHTTPFQTINYMANNAFVDNSTFYFYQTTKRFCFKSLENMRDQEEELTLTYGENTTLVGEDSLRILDYTGSKRFDLLTNLREGMYASTIVSHDILHKRLITTGYEAAKYLSYRPAYTTASKRIFDTKSIMDTNPEHKRLSERAALNNGKTLIEISGNNILEVGMNIVLNLPSSLSVRMKSPDVMASGLFLITKIKHVMTTETYHMVLQVNRND